MSDADNFLQWWVLENVNATLYDDTHTAERLAVECLTEAETRGITKADLIEAVGDLNAYMLAKLNRAVDEEVEDKVARDKS